LKKKINIFDTPGKKSISILLFFHEVSNNKTIIRKREKKEKNMKDDISQSVE
jgi:hypothetical protein